MVNPNLETVMTGEILEESDSGYPEHCRIATVHGAEAIEQVRGSGGVLSVGRHETTRGGDSERETQGFRAHKVSKHGRMTDACCDQTLTLMICRRNAGCTAGGIACLGQTLRILAMG